MVNAPQYLVTRVSKKGRGERASSCGQNSAGHIFRIAFLLSSTSSPQLPSILVWHVSPCRSTLFSVACIFNWRFGHKIQIWVTYGKYFSCTKLSSSQFLICKSSFFQMNVQEYWKINLKVVAIPKKYPPLCCGWWDPSDPLAPTIPDYSPSEVRCPSASASTGGSPPTSCKRWNKSFIKSQNVAENLALGMDGEGKLIEGNVYWPCCPCLFPLCLLDIYEADVVIVHRPCRVPC